MQLGCHPIIDDYQVAINQIEAVYNKSGTEYGYVVQRCLKCEFGVVDDIAAHMSRYQTELEALRIGVDAEAPLKAATMSNSEEDYSIC